MNKGFIAQLFLIIVVGFLLVGGIFAIWWFMQFPASYTYSQGERLGTLIKFSERGLFIKNWCGDLQVGSFTQTDKGIIANYSQQQYDLEFGIDRKVNDQKLIAKINSLSGKPVRIRYEQKAFGGHSLIGCSDYLVKDIEEVK